MKKLIAVSIILVLFSGMAFAQMADGLKLGAFGRVAFIPLEAAIINEAADGRDKDGDLAAGLGPDWGNTNGRTRLQFSGASEKIGFAFWLQSDNGTVGIGDFAGIWAKPFEWLRLDFGKFNVDNLRGKVGDGNFDNFVLTQKDQDAIFNRFGGRPGAAISVTPIEGLFIGAHLPVINEPAGGDAKEFAASMAKDVYYNAQFAVGYEFADVGLARLQYVGAKDILGRRVDNNNTPNDITDDTAYYGIALKRIEAAFALTAVEGMTLDIGGKFFLPKTEKMGTPLGEKDMTISSSITVGLEGPMGIPAFDASSIGNMVNVTAGFNMNIEDFGIYAFLDAGFGGGVEVKDVYKYSAPMRLQLNLIPSYNLGFAKVGLELGLELIGADKTEIPAANTTTEGESLFNFGAGLWIEQNLGKGTLKAGVSYTALDLKQYGEGDAQKNEIAGIFRIPVVMEISF